MSITDQKLFKLKGKLQQYAWGGDRFLPDFLGIKNEDNQSFAEYWLGAHDSAPSEIDNESKLSLNSIVKDQPVDVLGTYVEKEFGRLPYLLKLLDVKDMLSIQVHPTREEAEKEFQTEELKGIPRTASNRNYKDNNHKPELMVALSDFWLLHGFKPVRQLNEILISIPELTFLQKIFQNGDYRALYGHVMQMPQDQVNQILQPLLMRNIALYSKGGFQKTSEHFWASRAALSFNETGKIDRGIFSIYFFNLLHLKKDEAIFQDAGLPHAYLEGQNIEIMANSDNVLRGGLTNKYVDVQELMKHIAFYPTHPHIIHPDLQLNGEEIFTTRAKDFRLSCFRLDKNEQTEFSTTTTDIVLQMEGRATIKGEGGVIELKKGEAAIIFPATVHIHALEKMVLYRATTPVNIGE